MTQKRKSKENLMVLEVPRNSYTAFRLRYCDPFELYNSSAVISLGKIPGSWLLDKKSVLLAKLYSLDAQRSTSKEIKHKTVNQFENAINRRHKLDKPDTSLSNSKTGHPSTHFHLKHLHKSDALYHHHHRYFFSNLKEHLTHHSKEHPKERITQRLKEHFTHHPKDQNSKTGIPTADLDSLPDKFLAPENLKSCTPSSTLSPLFQPNHESIPRKNAQFQLHIDDALKEPSSKKVIQNYYVKDAADGESEDSDLSTQCDMNPPNSSRTITEQNLHQLMPSTPVEIQTQAQTQKQTETQLQSLPSPPNQIICQPQLSDYNPEKMSIDLNHARFQLEEKRKHETEENLTDSSLESFVTACETPTEIQEFEQEQNQEKNENHNKTDDQNLTQLPNVNTTPIFEADDETENKRKTLSFKSINKPKRTHSMAMFRLNSKKLQLDKATPFPCNASRRNTKLDQHDEDEDEDSDDEVIPLQAIETFSKADDYLIDSYEVLKTKTLGAKIGLNQELNKYERKRKLKRLFEHFQIGEIIKMEKMLVMVKVTEKFKINSENSQYSRVLEKWKEYIVVLRATGNVEYPAILQFFKTKKIFRKDITESLKNEIALEKEELKSEEEHEEAEEDEIYERSHPSGRLGKMRKEKEFKLQKEPSSHDCQFKVVLSINDTHVSFSNLLDKSIKVRKECKHSVFSYTILAHSSSSAITWLSLIRRILNETAENLERATLLVSVPTLNTSFTIQNFYNFYLATKENHQSSFITVHYRKDGYELQRIGIFDKVLNMITEEVQKLQKIKKLPNNQASDAFVDKLLNNRSFLALAFRKYDRLEWILGEHETVVQTLSQILGSSYELELREFHHESHILSNHSMVEPLPIEGFVVKLSNRGGKTSSEFGRNYFKLLYAFTVDNLLFFQEFFNAVPLFSGSPISSRHFISPAGDVLEMKDLESAMGVRSESFQTSPYPRTSHHIKWLRPGLSLEDYKDRDEDALYEAERRACMVSNSALVLDLCRVTDIKLVSKDEISRLVRAAGDATWNGNASKAENPGLQERLNSFTFRHHLNHNPPKRDEDQPHPSANDEIEDTDDDNDDDSYINLELNTTKNDENNSTENCIELVMDDGSVLRLQVCTRIIRNEWAKNLGKLSEYWTLKKKEDLARHVLLKEKNLAAMNVSDDMYETVVANERERDYCKWESSKAYTDPELYNISSHALDKPVIISGSLYQKRRKNKNFLKFFVVLSPGFLVLYEMFNRSKMSGVARPSTYYKKYATIALANCYVYANSGDETDVMTKGQSFDQMNPGGHALPRVYGDGWRSSESQEDRQFTVWFGSKKLMMKNMKNKNSTKLSMDKEELLFKDGNTSTKGLQMDSDTETDTGSDSDAYQEPNDSATESSDDESESILDSQEGLGTLKFLKNVSRLGVTGRAIMFLARSRIERDLWVTRLSTEIERFSSNGNNDIQLG